MEGAASVLPVVLVLVAVFAFIGLGLWWNHQRVAALREWCTRVGWTFVGTDSSLTSRWRGTPFGLGHTRRAHHAVTGTFAGRPALSFEYSYRTGSGKNQTTYTFHVVAVTLPTYLPNLELTPEGMGARLAKAFGGQDIQFESEEFNRRWRIQARDHKFAHDVLHPRLMERLLRPDAGGTSLRIEGTSILCWSSGIQRTERIAPRAALLCAVVDAVPRYVWQDHGHDPGYDPGSRFG